MAASRRPDRVTFEISAFTAEVSAEITVRPGVSIVAGINGVFVGTVTLEQVIRGGAASVPVHTFTIDGPASFVKIDIPTTESANADVRYRFRQRGIDDAGFGTGIIVELPANARAAFPNPRETVVLDISAREVWIFNEAAETFATIESPYQLGQELVIQHLFSSGDGSDFTVTLGISPTYPPGSVAVATFDRWPANFLAVGHVQNLAVQLSTTAVLFLRAMSFAIYDIRGTNGFVTFL